MRSDLPARWRRPGRLAPAAVAAALLALALPAAAAAGPKKEVCVDRAVAYDTPRGLVVAVLMRGTPVRVLRYGDGRTWARVRAPRLITGWVKAKTLCAP